MGSEIGHFCLLTVHREFVGGLENPPKHAYVTFEWPLSQTKQEKLFSSTIFDYLHQLFGRVIEVKERSWRGHLPKMIKQMKFS